MLLVFSINSFIQNVEKRACHNILIIIIQNKKNYHIKEGYLRSDLVKTFIKKTI